MKEFKFKAWDSIINQWVEKIGMINEGCELPNYMLYQDKLWQVEVLKVDENKKTADVNLQETDKCPECGATAENDEACSCCGKAFVVTDRLKKLQSRLHHINNYIAAEIDALRSDFLEVREIDCIKAGSPEHRASFTFEVKLNGRKPPRLSNPK